MVTSAAVGGTLQYGYNLAIMNAPTVVSKQKMCFFVLVLCLLVIVLHFLWPSIFQNLKSSLPSVSLQYIQNFVNETVQKRLGMHLEVYQAKLIWTVIVSVFSLGGLTGALLAGPMSIHFGRYNNSRFIILWSRLKLESWIYLLSCRYDSVLYTSMLVEFQVGWSIVIHRWFS